MSNVVPTKAELVEVFWRSLWTAIAGIGSAVTIPSLFSLNVSTLDALAIAAGGGAFTVILAYARMKQGTIPTPHAEPEPPATYFPQ